jgi:hypothetical protein
MVFFQEFQHARGLWVGGRRLGIGVLLGGGEVLSGSYGEMRL